ncbi:uncharacterized protein LOC126775174 isoform X1 [Nymphalis io]|uniref:uncharacterized protein LOC126775174 isoform X1 n=1 Tax=Inachis io TaxID=171585 RepID=UPI002168EC5B|nr:uncharacterized protein LOC126775174 isoform X1 [Nymphalis io]
MQRKQGFPIANCSIKMPDSSNVPMEGILEEEEPLQRRQQLINFGHAQWGFNNWNWSVTKQDLDFVELSNGKYTAGVVAFVSVKVKTLDIHRENIGYATSLAPNKGAAIHRARKCAVTNALRETLLSFGGTVATELVELLDARRPEPAEPPGESNANALNRLAEPRNSPQAGARKEPAPPCVAVKSASIPPVAKAHPMPANLPPAANRAPPANAPRPPPPPPAAAPVPAPPRPGSNVSFVLQPVPCAPLFGAPPRLAPPAGPPMFPNYYELAGPWHFAYEPLERAPANVNLNFPPRNVLVGRECKAREDHFAPTPQGCWIKPTIFYDGFWTEQKVKRWVAEQVEKQFPEDAHKTSSPGPPASKP